VIILKAIHYSLKKLILPKTTVVIMKVNNRTLRDDMAIVVGYSAAYLLICVILAMFLMLFGYSGIDSMSTITSAMGNSGLGVLSGDVWYNMHPVAKLDVILAMWMGRIEIYPSLLVLRALLDRLRVM